MAGVKAEQSETYEMPEIKCFLSLLMSDEFRAKLEELGGYSFDRTGETMIIRG